MKHKVYLAHTIKLSATIERQYEQEIMENFNLKHRDQVSEEDIVILALRDGHVWPEYDIGDFKI